MYLYLFDKKSLLSHNQAKNSPSNIYFYGTSVYTGVSLMTERMSVSWVRPVLTVLFLTTVTFTALCGFAAGQCYGPCVGYNAMPVAVSGPCGAVASAGGVTACADATGAIASAGGVAAGASAIFPAAFAGPVAPFAPYYGPGVFV
jgi:hypothetical protein